MSFKRVYRVHIVLLFFSPPTALHSAIWEGPAILVAMNRVKPAGMISISCIARTILCLQSVCKKRDCTETNAVLKENNIMKYQNRNGFASPSPFKSLADQLGAASTAAFTVRLLLWSKNSKCTVSASEEKNGRDKSLSAASCHVSATVQKSIYSCIGSMCHVRARSQYSLLWYPPS